MGLGVGGEDGPLRAVRTVDFPSNDVIIHKVGTDRRAVRMTNLVEYMSHAARSVHNVLTHAGLTAAGYRSFGFHCVSLG